MLVIQSVNYRTNFKLNINIQYLVLDTDDMTLEVQDGLSLIDMRSKGVIFPNYQSGVVISPFLNGRIININGIHIAWCGTGTLFVWVNGVCWKVGVREGLLRSCGIKPYLNGIIIVTGEETITISYDEGVVDDYESTDCTMEEFTRMVAVRKVM